MARPLSRHEKFTIGVLIYVNVLTYMDRYNVAGILGDLQQDFKIGDDYGGLLQTAFIVFYTVGAPIFGYMGDRYSRRLIMMSSLLVWALATVIGSFMPTYWLFFMTRSFVGMGQASFCSIAPTVIYDVTYAEIRKKMLALFYIAIPIGAGLGFVMGAKAAEIGGHWSWGLRITPFFSVLGVVLLSFIKDPVRGERERLDTGKTLTESTLTFDKDVKSLSRNRSYLLSTFGFTSVTFVAGALSWWGPKYMHSGFRLIPGEENITLAAVSMTFGVIAVCTGLIGVPLGAAISSKLQKRYPAIDPAICSFGLLVSSPMIVGALYYSDKCIPLAYITVFIGEMFMNFTWTIVADILLSTVVPESRSTAEAFQIAVSHAFGDAGSPYLVGLISEKLQSSWRKTQNKRANDFKLVNQHKAMTYAMLSITITQLIGGLLFLADAWFIVGDREVVIKAIAHTATRPSYLASTQVT